MALKKKPRAEAPHGSWKSPLTASFVSGASKRLEEAVVDSQERLLRLEGRPSEDGPAVLVRGGAQPEDVIPEGFNVRAVVQEWTGGGLKLLNRVNYGDTVVFSNFADQRLYKQSLDGGLSTAPLQIMRLSADMNEVRQQSTRHITRRNQRPRG